MPQACKNCATPFECSSLDLDFLKRISPTIDGETYEIPAPSLCPSCRLQRRLAHRNQIYVSLLRSETTTQRLFTMYFGSPPFPIISNQEWWDEIGWSPEQHGRDFDFSRPFFEQWAELRDSVPRPALNSISGTIENSEYCNNCGWLKNCYFCFDADRSRDCMYLENLADCVDCIDCTATLNCELCYDCAGCSKCYNLQSSLNCVECSDSFYLKNCRGCSSCFGCMNLHRATYCFFNQQLTEEAYREQLLRLNLTSWSERGTWQRRADDLFRGLPMPHLVGTRIENCNGNHIHSSRNVHNSYFITSAEDVRHCDIVKSGGRDLQDSTIAFGTPELMLETCICGLHVSRLCFCYNCWDGAHDLFYCDTAHGAQHCFGTVCMRKRSYCILNKQYSKEEYYRLLPLIINHMRKTGEWGEYFPMKLSPWPYNLSFASRYFPLTESGARGQGLAWLELPLPEVSSACATAASLPDGLPETNAAIIARCEVSGKVFRITSEEIRRLRQLKAPLPRVAYDVRMNERSARCGGLQLKQRTCSRSGQGISTVYGEREEPVVFDREVWEKDFA